MRLVYIDEAGTSAAEPVSVMAGIIVRPDAQWTAVAAAIEKCFDEFVPKIYRPKFHFHATEVFSGGKTIDRNKWPIADRMQFFNAFLRIPQMHEVPVTVGMSRRHTLEKEFYAKAKRDLKLKPHEFDHVMAFHTFVGSVGKFLRQRVEPGETGMLIAEDLQVMPPHLKRVVNMLRDNPLRLGPEHYRNDIVGLHTPAVDGMLYEAQNIIDTLHFVKKGEAPLLQLADACAFTARRYFAELSHGVELMTSLVHTPPFLGNWTGGLNASNFIPNNQTVYGSMEIRTP